MTKSNIQAIAKNKRELQAIFDYVEYPLLSSTEENFDLLKALGQRLKRFIFQDDFSSYYIAKLDSNNRPCNAPYMSPEELSNIDFIPDLFLYLNICSLKNHVEFVAKKKLSGFYYKYKDWHFLALQNADSVPAVYRIITVPPLKGRKPFEVVPYDILRSDLKI